MQSHLPHRRARAIWRTCHLYLALGAGFLFALLGLSGSLSVYQEELDQMLNPQLLIDAPTGTYRSLDRIVEAVRKAHPARHGAWTLEMPRSRRGMITAWYDNPHETIGAYYAPLMVSVNPYTAEVVASRFWGQTAATWLLDLHTQLQFGRSGWNSVGILGLALLVSIGSGLYLWWPGLGRIRQAFTIRHNAGTMRLLFDLHRALGLASALVLLLLAFTGFHLAYPKVLETLVGSPGMSHGNDGPAVRSTAVPNDNPVGLSDAEFIARSLFPRAELRRITTPDGNSGVYRINYRQSGEANRKHPFTVVWLDRWSGQIKAVRNPGGFSWGETFTTWIWPLHTGEAFGAWGRFLWFLTGLAPLLLYASGLHYWLQRRGSLPDRKVDMAALRPDYQYWQTLAYRSGRQIFRAMRRLTQKATEHAPWLRHKGAGLCSGLRSWLIARQTMRRPPT